MRRYHARHPERSKARTAKWLETNMPRKLARNYARVKRVQQATPPWVDLKEIAQFYLNCPLGCEVDHIWPLKGKRSSGLHVLWNLQYLPKDENRRKYVKEPL
jgi:5-methylcytosine-specific restriction endonuclease McrA